MWENFGIFSMKKKSRLLKMKTILLKIYYTHTQKINFKWKIQENAGTFNENHTKFNEKFRNIKKYIF